MIFIYLIRFPAGVGCTGSSSWMPFLGWDLVTTMVTTMVTTLLAAAAVQRPDLSLNVTLAPEPVTVIVVMVVIVIMLAPAIMVIMMMVVVVFAGLLSGRRHDGSGALLLHNHARSGVNALHSRERFKHFNIICARGFYYNTRIVTYYVGHSSRGLWGLVWSDFIDMNLVCDIESFIYHFM